MQDASSAPREIYRRRRETRLRSAREHRRIELRYSLLRLALFLATLVLIWPTLFTRTLAWPWLLLPIACFVAAALAHDRVIRRRTRAERAAVFYERGLARLDHRWAGEGNPGDAFADPQHPYSQDLDLFGRGSLFELLCTARTGPGERTLAAWLTEPAPPEQVRLRHEAVEELRDRLDLREALAVLGEDLRGTVHADRLMEWGEQPVELTRRWVPWIAAVLGVANFVSLVAWLAPLAQRMGQIREAAAAGIETPDVSLIAGSLSFWIAAGASGLLVVLYRARVARVLGAVDRPARELVVLSEILSVVEGQRFEASLLVELRATLDTAGRPPSARIARLARLVELNDSRENLIFRYFAALALLGTQLAFAMERWRGPSGPAVRRWLSAVGRIEALSALAGFAYERSDAQFPEMVDDGPLFEAEALAHPLLPQERCVPNDVRLGEVRLWIVSGSNMSGKSTLLRTVGINAVLAQAGAPVCGKRLRMSPLAVGACMRVLDSLQQGLSHFYAEITRLRALVDLGRQGRPLLFLLDEVLHGTNSHDRRIGAAAVMRGLVEADGIGLVTTHDLALAEIAGELGPLAQNVHFEDRLDGERIAFDYRLRPGIVRRSNALALMRAVGLDV